MHRVIVFAAVLWTGAAAAAASQPAPAAQLPASPSIMTVGEALVRRAPDRAFVTASVETRAKNPRDAQRQNAEIMSAVQQRLVGAGIPRDAVRTTGYSMQQEFDFSNGRRIPRDFLAQNGVEVRVDAIDRTGEIIDTLVQAGATTVGGVRFDLKERAAAEREALTLAVADARARAEALAAAAGQTVDRVLRIEEQRQVQGREVAYVAAAKIAGAPDTPIEPSTIEIRAHIVLTVSIK
jgi:uncharacterized protein YggE